MSYGTRPIGTNHGGDAPRPQVRLLAIGGVIGGVLLGVSLFVNLAGFNNAETSKFPTIGPGQTSLPKLPSNLPSVPSPPSGLPTRFPTGLPSLPPLPTDLPAVPGGGQ
jgi:hypothetical protein